MLQQFGKAHIERQGAGDFFAQTGRSVTEPREGYKLRRSEESSS